MAEGSKTGKMPAWVEEFKFTPARRSPGEGGGEPEEVTMEDIVAGKAPRPRVLDMFAGGGAIPLEALRLGCEAYALDLNPVAYIIELCTLVYPQKYGKPDPNARGMTGPPMTSPPVDGGDKGGVVRSWGGLAAEVRYWGNWVLQKVKAEIGDLYPPIPDPKAGKVRKTLKSTQMQMAGEGYDKPGQQELAVDTPLGYLTPIAYLWTRTVKCKNPACGATVPLVRQTWLCKKDKRYVALKMVAPKGQKQVRFEVVESSSEHGFGFSPDDFSEAGNATCPFCGTVADSNYVKDEGCSERFGQQPMAVVCRKPGKQGRVYVGVAQSEQVGGRESLLRRLADCCTKHGISEPSEKIEANPRSMDVQRYGFVEWQSLFMARQKSALLTFVMAVRRANDALQESGHDPERSRAVLSYLGTAVDREAEDSSTLCRWNPVAEKMQATFGRQSLPVVWDFCEINPFGESVGDWSSIVDLQVNAIQGAAVFGGMPARVVRGSATELPFSDALMDAVVTDPPYYDNVQFSHF